MKLIMRKYLKWVDAPIWVKIGRNIRDCRKWKDLSAEQVALRSKIDLRRYKRMERGVTKDINFDETHRIALAIKVDEEDIDHHH